MDAADDAHGEDSSLESLGAQDSAPCAQAVPSTLGLLWEARPLYHSNRKARTMIYGYALKTLNDDGLFEMKEVTFAASPQVLREIASFLNAMAAQMEAGAFDKCSHQHIQIANPDWARRFPNKDIIVIRETQGRRPSRADG
jgi:hypothetical protein